MNRVADYQTSRQIGTGSHGQVWVAQPPQRIGVNASQVAVKVFDRPVSRPELDLVAEEMRLFVSLGHPHLLTYYDVGLAGNRLYMAMELAERGSLADATHPMDPSEKARAVAAAARGVHAMHEAGLAHREIKPANIMLTDGGVELGDPGVSHVFAPGQTVTGVASVGTVEFMEPSVVRGERVARASDIWSLGVTLHWALSGTSVYGKLPDGNMLTILKHVVGGQPKPSADIRAERLDIIHRCLEANRADRYATALELAEAIERTEQLVAAG